ncbi:MAG TPA: cupin domain-containing protein [Mycobacteriales bacterium]|nr:cupin domain-containing protein [Mycobacteriales bacterium]
MSALGLPLTVVPPGAGTEGFLGTIGVVFKLDSAETGGDVSVVEHPFPVGSIVPPHRHTREDEFSFVLEGEIGFRSEDQEAVLGAGGYITKPRGEVHTMWNAGQVPARMIEIISPGGFEGFFRELSDLIATEQMNFDALKRVADGYGLELARPDWLDDIIKRYELTPPPGA